MKPETIIYEKIKTIIPNGSDKTVFFVSITETSYGVFFYSFINGKAFQCYELAEDGELDENDLDSVFEFIVNTIKESKRYRGEQINIVTITLDKLGVRMDVEYREKGTRMYKIKKEWEQKKVLS